MIVTVPVVSLFFTYLHDIISSPGPYTGVLTTLLTHLVRWFNNTVPSAGDGFKNCLPSADDVV